MTTFGWIIVGALVGYPAGLIVVAVIYWVRDGLDDSFIQSQCRAEAEAVARREVELQRMAEGKTVMQLWDELSTQMSAQAERGAEADGARLHDLLWMYEQIRPRVEVEVEVKALLARIHRADGASR